MLLTNNRKENPQNQKKKKEGNNSKGIERQKLVVMVTKGNA
jgi:hypothetical protein